MDAQPPASEPSHLTWATFLGAWGRLTSVGVDSVAALEVLAEEGPPKLRKLAAGLAGAQDAAAREAALEASGVQVPGWLAALLVAEPGTGAGLLGASALLRRDGGLSWSPASTWARLAILHQGGAKPGDALGALAHEAREHGRKGLSEALNSAARRARQGKTLVEALSGASGYTRVERLAVDRLEAAGLESVIAALEELAALQEVEGERSVVPEAAGEEDPLARLAEAASAGRRGLERVLTGLGGMLGIDRDADQKHAHEVAREAVARRSESDEAPVEGSGEAEPEAQPPAPSPGPRKTIGGDSGPVRLNELHAQGSVKQVGPAGRVSWLAALEEARARVTLLEVQPTEAGLGEQVRRELLTLKGEARGLGLAADHLETLAELQTRYHAWQRKYGES